MAIERKENDETTASSVAHMLEVLRHICSHSQNELRGTLPSWRYIKRLIQTHTNHLHPRHSWMTVLAARVDQSRQWVFYLLVALSQTCGSHVGFLLARFLAETAISFQLSPSLTENKHQNRIRRATCVTNHNSIEVKTPDYVGHYPRRLEAISLSIERMGKCIGHSVYRRPCRANIDNNDDDKEKEEEKTRSMSMEDIRQPPLGKAAAPLTRNAVAITFGSSSMFEELAVLEALMPHVWSGIAAHVRKHRSEWREALQEALVSNSLLTVPTSFSWPAPIQNIKQSHSHRSPLSSIHTTNTHHALHMALLIKCMCPALLELHVDAFVRETLSIPDIDNNIVRPRPIYFPSLSSLSKIPCKDDNGNDSNLMVLVFETNKERPHMIQIEDGLGGCIDLDMEKCTVFLPAKTSATLRPLPQVVETSHGRTMTMYLMELFDAENLLAFLDQVSTLQTTDLLDHTDSTHHRVILIVSSIVLNSLSTEFLQANHLVYFKGNAAAAASDMSDGTSSTGCLTTPRRKKHKNQNAVFDATFMQHVAIVQQQIVALTHTRGWWAYQARAYHTLEANATLHYFMQLHHHDQMVNDDQNEDKRAAREYLVKNALLFALRVGVYSTDMSHLRDVDHLHTLFQSHFSIYDRNHDTHWPSIMKGRRQETRAFSPVHPCPVKVPKSTIATRQQRLHLHVLRLVRGSQKRTSELQTLFWPPASCTRKQHVLEIIDTFKASLETFLKHHEPDMFASSSHVSASSLVERMATIMKTDEDPLSSHMAVAASIVHKITVASRKPRLREKSFMVKSFDDDVHAFNHMLAHIATRLDLLRAWVDQACAYSDQAMPRELHALMRCNIPSSWLYDDRRHVNTVIDHTSWSSSPCLTPISLATITHHIERRHEYLETRSRDDRKLPPVIEFGFLQDPAVFLRQLRRMYAEARRCSIESLMLVLQHPTTDGFCETNAPLVSDRDGHPHGFLVKGLWLSQEVDHQIVLTQLPMLQLAWIQHRTDELHSSHKNTDQGIHSVGLPCFHFWSMTQFGELPLGNERVYTRLESMGVPFDVFDQRASHMSTQAMLLCPVLGAYLPVIDLMKATAQDSADESTYLLQN
jgi:hypothetical protein